MTESIQKIDKTEDISNKNANSNETDVDIIVTL